MIVSTAASCGLSPPRCQGSQGIPALSRTDAGWRQKIRGVLWPGNPISEENTRKRSFVNPWRLGGSKSSEYEHEHEHALEHEYEHEHEHEYGYGENASMALKG